MTQADPDLERERAADKARLRRMLKTRRAREARQLPKAGEALACRMPSALLEPGPAIAAGYAPIGDEIEPGGALAQCRAAGARLALPAVTGPDAPLEFRSWAFGDGLEEGPHGTRQPGPDAAVVRPDLVLVPCLGFDQHGGRLGYGGGYYDRTLAALRAEGSVAAVGLAFEGQRLDLVPAGPHDQALDWIITEAAAYRAAPLHAGAAASARGED